MTTRGRLLGSVAGGSAVAAIGLSQVLAVGALSVIPLGAGALAFGVVAAFVTATLGSFVVALVSRAPGEVSGPRTSISVIYAALCADIVTRGGPGVSIGEVMAALSIAVVLMGVLQMLAGWARLGDAVKFLPSPVNEGFVTGIGLLVVWSQVGPLLGLEGRLATYDWPDLVTKARPLALVIGAATMAIVWLVPRFTRRVQPLLAGLVGGTLLYHLFALAAGPNTLGSTLGTFAPTQVAMQGLTQAWRHVELTWLIDTAAFVLPYSGFLALQGILNAALISTNVAEVTGVRANMSRVLVAQGAGNLLCGALAALPLGSSPSQSMTAARMKGVNDVVPAASALILLAAVLLIGPVLAVVPMVVLAGLLVTTGIGVIGNWTRELFARVMRGADVPTDVRWNLAIIVAVAATFFFGSVPLALLVGVALAMVLLAVNLSAATDVLSEDTGNAASTRVWPAEQAQWLVGARRSIAIFRPRGGLFFGTADRLSRRFAALDHGITHCLLDLSRLTTIDATGCQIIAAGAKKLSAAKITTVLVRPRTEHVRDQELIALGLTHPDPHTHWFEDLDRALEWVETQLLNKGVPGAVVDAPLALSDVPLTKGMSAGELKAVESCFQRVEVKSGPLFRCGDPGSSMFVISEGLVEIRMSREKATRATRLAAFGPGSMFGEIAMLTSERRTADAYCVGPAVLYELRREALLELERGSPALYARIMTNLGVHLANRLVVATAIMQAQQ